MFSAEIPFLNVCSYPESAGASCAARGTTANIRVAATMAELAELLIDAFSMKCILEAVGSGNADRPRPKRHVGIQRRWRNIVVPLQRGQAVKRVVHEE